MMERRPVLHRLVASLLAIASTGCYSYVPLEEGVRPNAGDEVRVETTSEDEGQSSGGPSEFQGRVVRSQGDSLVLSARLQPALAATFEGERREFVRLAYTDIQRIDQPKLDGLRTGALVVGGLGVLAGFMAIVLAADDSGSPSGPGNGPSLQVRIP